MALLGGLVVLSVVLVVVYAHNDPDFWSAAVPGLFTGCGTLALAAVTYAVLRTDQQDRRKRDLEARRAQASLVHVGVATRGTVAEPTQVRDDYGNPQMTRFPSWTVPVVNGSSYPILDVSIRAAVHLGEHDPEAKDTVLLQCCPRLLPGASWEAQFILRHADLCATEMQVDVQADFSDAGGRRWRREPDYRLTDITGADV